MEASPKPEGEPIALSDIMPMPVRLIFGGFGLAGTILLLVELGPFLWPPSFLTLFFGFIGLAGLSVTLAFLLGSVFSPDQIWEIRPGRLTVTYQLFNQISVQTYGLDDLSGVEVMASSWDSGADTYQLVCSLPLVKTARMGLESTPLLQAILAFLRAPIATLRRVSYAETWLRSPDFSKREEAERALAHLMAR
jgi:hypothetical protein